ncbi:multimodular transpeptidase-transglycosylase [Vibrio astriarenae]|nr:multimodular transpeptidase-transglycosylase [Vibrio sp. C7]
MGFDTHTRKLGRTSTNRNLGKDQVTGAEAGARTAQPAWVDFMSVALEGVPQERKAIPKNIVRVRIDRDSGLLTNQFDGTSMFEYFEEGTEPKDFVRSSSSGNIYSDATVKSCFNRKANL